MKPKTKLSYFLSHPIQYFSPLLKEMDNAFDMQVYYYSDISVRGGVDKGFGRKIQWDVPLLDGYNYRFIKNYSKSNSISNRFFDAVNPGVIKHLWKDESEIVVVNGWDYCSTILVIIFARLFGKQVWLRAENPLSQELIKSNKVLLIKKVLLSWLLFPLVNKFLYIGKESREFFRHYGARNHQLVYTPYAVDNDYFNEHYYALKNDVNALRDKLDLPRNKKIILFSGKYITKKRPMDLLKAFHQLQDDNTLLLMVGEGELRGEMESFIKEHGLKNVLLTGFVNQSRIPEYYMAADVFVMCSGEGETWGLAVNEAMNFAKPVIVSSICGCSDDLVHQGKNGFVFEKGNVTALTAHLRKILADDNFRARAGYQSKQIVGAYSISKIVTNLSNAAQPKARILRPIRTIYRLILKYRSVGIY